MGTLHIFYQFSEQDEKAKPVGEAAVDDVTDLEDDSSWLFRGLYGSKLQSSDAIGLSIDRVFKFLTALNQFIISILYLAGTSSLFTR